MSAPPRRRSRRLATAAPAAPSPDTPPPARLLDLPTELLVRALSRCDPADIARVAAVSLLFHASLAVEGIRLHLQEAGYELPAQPEGESCAVRWLCFYALLCEANPPARLAAGARHSLFIDGEGRLSSCGAAAESEEDEEDEEEDREEFPPPTHTTPGPSVRRGGHGASGARHRPPARTRADAGGLRHGLRVGESWDR